MLCLDIGANFYNNDNDDDDDNNNNNYYLNYCLNYRYKCCAWT